MAGRIVSESDPSDGQTIDHRRSTVSADRIYRKSGIEMSPMRLLCRGLDVRNLDIKRQCFSSERMVEIHDDGVFFDLVHTHRNSLALRALSHQHGADL